MKLRLEDITAEAKELSFAEPEAEINRILSQGPIREYQVENPIEVEVSYYRAGMDVFIDGHINATVGAACARCAEDFGVSSDRSFRYVMSPKAAGFGNAPGAGPDDADLTVYEGDEIDLSPLVREQLMLSLPTRPLCRDDCRGLCSHCGVNLNRAACTCAEHKFDPRFAALRGLTLRPRSN